MEKKTKAQTKHKQLLSHWSSQAQKKLPSQGVEVRESESGLLTGGSAGVGHNSRFTRSQSPHLRNESVQCPRSPFVSVFSDFTILIEYLKRTSWAVTCHDLHSIVI